MPDRPRPLLVALLTTLAGAVGTAAFDVTLAALRSSDPVPGGSFMSALVAALGLYGAAAALLGLAIGVVAGSISATLPSPLARARDLHARLRQDPERDHAVAAGLFAAGAAAGVVAAIVFVFLRAVALEMSNPRNTALSTALVAAAAVPAAALAWFPLYRAARPVARVLPRPRALVALLALLSVAGLGVLLALFSVDWRVINFGPLVATAAFTAFAVGHAAFWYGGRGAPLRERVSLNLRRAFAVAVALVLALSFAWTWTRFGGDARAVTLLGEESAGGRPLLALARRAADRDHDGFAGRLGGGDCDDRAPDTHPGADDTPGDGIDQDCSGTDARPVAAAAPKPNAPPPSTPSPAPAPAAPKLGNGRNFLLITVDTLRADRMSAAHMPKTFAWASKDATVFTRAYAQAPNTPRSFPSMLTGRYPSQVKWARTFANFSPITDENVTIFELLKSAGVRTEGVFSHFYMVPATGVNQGFDLWDNAGALTLHDSNTDIAAPRITPRVVERLEKLAASGERFALWTHYFEPHSRYMEHKQYPATATGTKGLEQKYDGEVRFVDDHIAQLLAALAKTGLDKSTTVIIFSDHGEAFGEHRFGGEQMYFHGQTIYDELLRVPLVVRVPGAAPRTVDDRVMLIDIAPTIADLAGLPPAPSFQGRSLVPALADKPLEPVPVYAELLPAPSWNHNWRALIRGDKKLLYKISENTVEMYDLAGDPTEQRNLSSSQAGEAAELKQALVEFMSGTLARARGDGASP